MQKWVEAILSEPTTSVPNAAKILKIGRNQGYEAARRGEIPTERFGKRIIVPTAWLRGVLRLNDGEAA